MAANSGDLPGLALLVREYNRLAQSAITDLVEEAKVASGNSVNLRIAGPFAAATRPFSSGCASAR